LQRRPGGLSLCGRRRQKLFDDYSRERGSFVVELQTLIAGLGVEPEHTGSVAGALHRGWIDLKSALSQGDEHAVLAECERGEDSAVAEYKEALLHEELPPNVRDVVNRQYARVQDAHNRIRDLRDSWEE
jgi:uncharacterized protein (TIGR02284 family)